MTDLILKRYEIKQKILDLRNKVNELKKAEELLDKLTIYRALKKVDIVEANRFKRLHLDTRKDGIFHLRVKNSLKIPLPEITQK